MKRQETVSKITRLGTQIDDLAQKIVAIDKLMEASAHLLSAQLRTRKRRGKTWVPAEVHDSYHRYLVAVRNELVKKKIRLNEKLNKYIC